MHEDEAVKAVNAGEEITKEALTQAVVNLLNEGGAAKVQVAALAEQLRTMAADLALRTESCEMLLKESRSFEEQLQAALAKSEQRREALTEVWEREKLSHPDICLSVQAALSPDAPSAPTKEPEYPPSLAGDQRKERDTLAAELREAKAECARLTVLLNDGEPEMKAENAKLREALHRISLASQNSMANKDECGRIAREALGVTPGGEP